MGARLECLVRLQGSSRWPSLKGRSCLQPQPTRRESPESEGLQSILQT